MTRLVVPKDIFVKSETFDISYGSYEGFLDDDTDRAYFFSDVIEKLNEYSLDVMLLTAYDDVDVQLVYNALPKEYSVVGTFYALNKSCAVICRNDRFVGEMVSKPTDDNSENIVFEFSDLNGGDSFAIAYSFAEDADDLSFSHDENVVIYESMIKGFGHTEEKLSGYDVEFNIENTLGDEKSTVTRYISHSFYVKESFHEENDDNGYLGNFAFGKYRRAYTLN